MNVYIKFNIIIHHFSILEIYSTIYGMYDTQIIYNRGGTQDPQKLRSLGNRLWRVLPLGKI